MARSRYGTASGPLRLRLLLAGAAVLLCLALLLPLWSTRMEAPQYQGDEVLEVRVYAGRIRGDIREIDLLNQYVGVHLPLETPELRAAPWVLGSVLALTLMALVLSAGPARRLALVLAILLALTATTGAGLLQYRLFRMGHDRSEAVMTGVPDFTPPIVGTKKGANFGADMGLGGGSWACLGAVLLLVWASRGRRTQRVSQGLSAEPPARSPHDLSEPLRAEQAT